MVAAVLTAAVTAVISFNIFRREGRTPDWKNIRPGIAMALLYLCAAVLFREYGYSVWKQERYYILLCAMPALARTDYRERRIPNRLLLVLSGLRLLILMGEIITYTELWKEFMLLAFGGAAGSFLLMTAAYFLSRGRIGLGDVKLVTVTGFYLGFSLNYTVLFCSLIFAAGWGLWNVWKKKMSIKDSVAFAPFLAAGLTVSLMLGL